MLEFILLLSQVYSIVCLSDSTCFVSTVIPAAPVVVNSTKKETERACQIACGEDARCSSIVFNDPACFLLGSGANSTVGCSEPVTIQSKTLSGCSARSDPRAELGNDRCTNAFYSEDLVLNRSGICNRTRDYILRGIDEFGARVSLDNDISNILTFNATRNMWMYKFAATGYTKWLVAASCATADATCACSPFPMLSRTITGGVKAQTDLKGACKNTSHKLSFFGGKFKATDIAQTFSAAESSMMNITCKAGIWLLNYVDGHNGWQITNATCAP